MGNKTDDKVFELVEGGDKLNLFKEDTDEFLTGLRDLQIMKQKFIDKDYSGYENKTALLGAMSLLTNELGFLEGGAQEHESARSKINWQTFQISDKMDNIFKGKVHVQRDVIPAIGEDQFYRTLRKSSETDESGFVNIPDTLKFQTRYPDKSGMRQRFDREISILKAVEDYYLKSKKGNKSK